MHFTMPFNTELYITIFTVHIVELTHLNWCNVFGLPKSLKLITTKRTTKERDLNTYTQHV